MNIPCDLDKNKYSAVVGPMEDQSVTEATGPRCNQLCHVSTVPLGTFIIPLSLRFSCSPAPVVLQLLKQLHETKSIVYSRDDAQNTGGWSHLVGRTVFLNRDLAGPMKPRSHTCAGAFGLAAGLCLATWSATRKEGWLAPDHGADLEKRFLRRQGGDQGCSMA